MYIYWYLYLYFYLSHGFPSSPGSKHRELQNSSRAKGRHAAEEVQRCAAFDVSGPPAFDDFSSRPPAPLVWEVGSLGEPWATWIWLEVVLSKFVIHDQDLEWFAEDVCEFRWHLARFRYWSDRKDYEQQELPEVALAQIFQDQGF